MSTIVLLVIFFVLFNTSLKLSFWKFWETSVFGLVMGTFIWVIYPFAISQSSVVINNHLFNNTIRENFTVLLTVETFIYFAFCFTFLSHSTLENTGNKYHSLLRLFPGLLVFPVLFYLFLLVVFNNSGVNFSSLALYFSIAVTLFFPLSSIGFKYLIPENDFRIEIFFISGVLLIVLGLVSTFEGNLIYKIDMETHFTNFAFGIGIFILLAIFGFISHKISWQFKNKKLNGRNL